MDNDVPVLNILLAEDNLADVLLVREVLSEERIACTLHVMKDGEKAIKFIEGLDVDPVAAPFDMVLLDMHLPKCDGEEILNKLPARCLSKTQRAGLSAGSEPIRTSRHSWKPSRNSSARMQTLNSSLIPPATIFRNRYEASASTASFWSSATRPSWMAKRVSFLST